MSKFDAFMAEYGKQLRLSVEKDSHKPADQQEYCWHDLSMADVVVEKMGRALKEGTYNHNSNSFRRTCKALGIPYTRKAINQFIQG